MQEQQKNAGAIRRRGATVTVAESLILRRAVFVKFHWGGVEVLAIEVDDRANA